MLDKRNLYRFPWTMNDNPIAWLEVTDECNISCFGCYRKKLCGHKPLSEIKKEILFFKRWRNPDNITISGGEALMHPDIVEIVKSISKEKIKPVIITNGTLLTKDMLKKLKAAGVAGFIIHIDSRQKRPGWENKTETELNELRQHYADLIYKEKGIFVNFNYTVYNSNFDEIPKVINWAKNNIRKVQGLVFVTYKSFNRKEAVAGNSSKVVNVSELTYSGNEDEKFITGEEVYNLIKENFPEYDVSAYTAGTVLHDSFKWLAAIMIGTNSIFFGAAGKKGVEISQTFNHLFHGRYNVYFFKKGYNAGIKIFFLAFFDKSIRKTFFKWLKFVSLNPLRLFSGVYLQSIGIGVAPTILKDGSVDMCEGCPDMTYYKGKLVSSCRLDEYRLYGNLISPKPRD